MSAAFWTALGGFLATLSAIGADYLQTRSHIGKVEVKVNAHFDEKIARIGQLVAALTAAGVSVPTSPEETATPDDLPGPGRHAG